MICMTEINFDCNRKNISERKILTEKNVEAFVIIRKEIRQ